VIETIKRRFPHFEAFDAFPPSHKREYIEWIAEGKARNWKYMKK